MVRKAGQGCCQGRVGSVQQPEAVAQQRHRIEDDPQRALLQLLSNHVCREHRPVPDPAAYPVLYTLSGPALAGAETIFAILNGAGERSHPLAVPVVQGVATIEGSVVQTLGEPLWILIFVDSNGNGACDDQEAGLSDSIQPSGPFESPRFEGASVLRLDGPMAVCEPF